MKKKTTAIIILALAMVVLALTSSNMTSARASSNYSIQSVNHRVEVLYNGYVLLNDTITISGQTDSFLLGLPHAFGPNVINAIAYSANDTSNTFPVSLNVPLEDRTGFYGVKVDFSGGTPQVFSVVFVLSSYLLEQNPSNITEFGLIFPAFPSLTETASIVNCSVVIPDATYENGTISSFTYNAENLSAFTYNTSRVIFVEPAGEIQVLDIEQFTREVNINSFGQIAVSDAYKIINNSTFTTDSMDIVLPPNASNIAANDQIGTPTVTPAATGSNPNRYTINFTILVDPTRSITFTVNYNLPDNVYVSRQDGNFAVNMSFFQDSISYMDQASVRFVLPDGARLSSFATTSTGNLYDVNRDVYQETMSVSEQNVISMDSFIVSLSYSHNSLWLASGPIMWVWTLAIVGSVVVVVWKRPRAQIEMAGPSATLRLRPEDTRAFVDAYDEKMKIEMEIDALEARVQKGRIPRRRYKVQKKTLEIRLSALDRTLAEAGGKMHSAGGHYSDMMRQLEVAETEIDEAEGNIKSIDARQTRGEISLETHRKLLADYERRKDRARTAINGILLRLREETH
ncbi:MAG TPA: hypothetical protein VMT42_00500 [candidate division Zixibacteria bacterium]|nr:hypothetical protein [candidate division Zixibacteria bacterium]